MSYEPMRIRKDLKSIVYPYLFVLAEGTAIEHNALDFSLTMLLTASKELLPSPSVPIESKKKGKEITHDDQYP